jgi:hypothetical protein
VKKAGEVGRASFVAGDQPARVLEPGEEPFHAPAALVASEGAAVLGHVDPVAAMRGDQLDPALGEHAVEAVAVIRGIANQAKGIVGEELAFSVCATSWVSCGEAEAMVMATGRPARSAMAMILVPLPRLVFPTQSPFFLRSRRSRR